MKKIFSLLFFVCVMLLSFKSADAVSYSEGINSNKPMALMVYADWADDIQSVNQMFRTMEQIYGNKYNFVSLNIASSEAKAFNKNFYIYPNLPYIILMRNSGKVSRFLKKDCVMNKSCFDEKLKFFVN